jgi:hypothetical protein
MARIQVGVLMKIYMVTIKDQDTIDGIDHAMEVNEEIFIGPWVQKGPVEDIQEYVNVDSP